MACDTSNCVHSPNVDPNERYELRENKIEAEQQVELRELENSVEEKNAQLMQLNETNSILLWRIEEVEARMADLRETRASKRKELNYIRSERVELKHHNVSLWRENARLMVQEKSCVHQYLVLRIKEDFLEVEDEFVEAWENFRREVKRRQGKIKRFRNWCEQKIGRLRRVL